MKKLFVLAACLFALLADTTAQSNKEDIDIIQSVYGKDKKALMEAYMTIPEKSSVAFWKLYDEYEVKRKAIGRKKIALLEQYAQSYTNLDNAKALQLSKSSINANIEYENLMGLYLQKFGAVIGGKEASKLIQMETYLQTVVRLAIQDHIPFIGEMDKEKIKQ